MLTSLARRQELMEFHLKLTGLYTAGTYTGSVLPINFRYLFSKLNLYVTAHDPSVTTFNNTSIGNNSNSAKWMTLQAQGPVGALILANTGFQAYSSSLQWMPTKVFQLHIRALTTLPLFVEQDRNKLY